MLTKYRKIFGNLGKQSHPNTYASDRVITQHTSCDLQKSVTCYAPLRSQRTHTQQIKDR
ncbi:MAG: hypothetical protein H0X31_01110 [Nostocaceae cyanobacterium]|nr:hypothetical protein [Nostocaceae cyanobacterium]